MLTNFQKPVGGELVLYERNHFLALRRGSALARSSVLESLKIHVDNVIILINGPPQVMLFTIDLNGPAHRRILRRPRIPSVGMKDIIHLLLHLFTDPALPHQKIPLCFFSLLAIFPLARTTFINFCALTWRCEADPYGISRNSLQDIAIWGTVYDGKVHSAPID